MNITGRQQKPGILKAASRQHVQASRNRELPTRPARCLDMVDRFPIARQLDMDGMRAKENAKLGFLPEFGSVSLGEIGGRAPPLQPRRYDVRAVEARDHRCFAPRKCLARVKREGAGLADLHGSLKVGQQFGVSQRPAARGYPWPGIEINRIERYAPAAPGGCGTAEGTTAIRLQRLMRIGGLDDTAVKVA